MNSIMKISILSILRAVAQHTEILTVCLDLTSDILICFKYIKHIELHCCKIYYSINNCQMNNKSHDFHLLKLSILKE